MRTQTSLLPATKKMLTSKQREANKALAESKARYILLYGGSRSAKTYLIVRNIILRALKAPGSRHLISRFTFNSCKTSIGMDTMPKVLANEFPDVKVELNKSDWFFKFPNGSEIWLGGSDSKERVDKILGKEYATIFNNECSQIDNDTRYTLHTRLAQKVNQIIDGVESPLKLKEMNDCNPPRKSHWSYKRHILKRDIETGEPLKNPEDYFAMQMNPQDNIDNIDEDYIKSLETGSARQRKRFLLGEFADDVENGLFNEDDFEKWRQTNADLPDMVRVIVGVDPSGSGDEDNADNDAIGILVGGLGTDGNAYIMEDATIKAGPAVWGRISISAYERHLADLIVAEKNFGGEMVAHVLKTAGRANFKLIHSSRGKQLRIEPFSSLVAQGKVRHVGKFNELEDELCAFTTYGYTGDKSPNRADAWAFVLAELFPGLVRTKDKPKIEFKMPETRSWM